MVELEEEEGLSKLAAENFIEFLPSEFTLDDKVTWQHTVNSSICDSNAELMIHLEVPSTDVETFLFAVPGFLASCILLLAYCFLLLVSCFWERPDNPDRQKQNSPPCF